MVQRSVCLFYLVVLSQLPVSHGSPNSPQNFDRTTGTKAADTALCVVDVAQAALSLGMAGTSIQAATKLCKPPLLDGDAKAKCSTAVHTALFMFIYTGSFLASSASNCAKTVNFGAYCAADVTGLVGSLAALGAAASSMTQSCGGDRETSLPGLFAAPAPKTPPRNGTRPRALEGEELEPKAQSEAQRKAVASSSEDARPDRFAAAARFALNSTAVTASLQAAGSRWAKSQAQKVNTANCVFRAGFTATFLARAGLALNAAVRDCNPFKVHLEGAAGQMACSVQITGIIGSFSWVARVLSMIVSGCEVEVQRGAVCAADIATVIAAAAGVAASGASFELSCGGRGSSSDEPQVLPDRRLSAIIASNASDSAGLLV